jgi:hypothetical protein
MKQPAPPHSPLTNRSPARAAHPGGKRRFLVRGSPRDRVACVNEAERTDWAALAQALNPAYYVKMDLVELVKLQLLMLQGQSSRATSRAH